VSSVNHSLPIHIELLKKLGLQHEQSYLHEPPEHSRRCAAVSPPCTKPPFRKNSGAAAPTFLFVLTSLAPWVLDLMRGSKPNSGDG
jgi:hypothetical protein